MILAPNWSLLQMIHNSSSYKVRRQMKVNLASATLIISFLLMNIDIDNTNAAGQSNSGSANQVQQNNANASSGGTTNN